MERRSTNKEMRDSAGAVVFFDVDKTLVEDFSIMIFAEHLNSAGVLANSVHKQMREDMALLKETPGQYINFANVIVGHFYAGLAGISQEEIYNHGRNFLSTYLTYLMPFSKELVDRMNEQGETIVISGAPLEAFEFLAQELGISSMHLLEGEVVDGIFTGRVKINMALPAEKRRIIEAIEAEGFNRSTSFAFGDSSGDVPILEAVNNAFVVKPNPDFEKTARENGWTIVNEGSIIPDIIARINQLKAI